MNEFLQKHQVEFKEPLPEHLQGLVDELRKHYRQQPDEREFSDIALHLARLATKHKDENLSAVAEYLGRVHQARRRDMEQYVQLQDSVGQWVNWARNWTQGKT